MIFAQPFVLASQYLFYVVLIVLLGTFLVEFLTHKNWWLADQGRIRRLLVLAAIVALGISIIAIDFFVDIGQESAKRWQWVPMALTVIISWPMISWAWRGTLKLPLTLAGSSIIIGAVAFGLIQQGEITETTSWRIAGSVVAVVAVLLYYSFIIKTLVLNGPSLRANPPAETINPAGRQRGGTIFFGFSVLILALIAGYFGRQSFIDPRFAPGYQESGPVQTVTVRLKWIPQAQFSGMYIAEQKGHYRDENIEVDLLPFDYEHQPINDVVSGFGTFGVAGADELLAARSQGLPVVALAAIYQDSPVALTVLTNSGITDLADLKGKRIGLWDPLDDDVVGGDELMGRIILKEADLDLYDDTKPVFVGFDGVEKLIDDQVDAVMSYLTDEPIRLARLGHSVHNFNPSDYGIQFYGDVLFTTERVIQDNPELVRRFVKATLRGWNYALLNPEEAVTATLQYENIDQYGPMSREHESSVLAASALLIKPTPDVRVGAMDLRIWQEMSRRLAGRGALNQPFDLRDVFTTKFLPTN